jgi:hypothetical protein
MTEFSHILGLLEPWVHEYGALAIFLILTLESFGVPLPGESLLIVAAILAGRGTQRARKQRGKLEKCVGEGQEIDSEHSEQRAECLVLNARKKSNRSLEAGDVLRG